MRKASPISKSTHVYCILVHRTIQPKNYLCQAYVVCGVCVLYETSEVIWRRRQRSMCYLLSYTYVKLSPFILSRRVYMRDDGEAQIEAFHTNYRDLCFRTNNLFKPADARTITHEFD